MGRSDKLTWQLTVLIYIYLLLVQNHSTDSLLIGKRGPNLSGMCTMGLASQGCRVCFAHPISKNHTLFLPILTLKTLQNIGLHTQYWWNAHPGVSFLAKPMMCTNSHTDTIVSGLNVSAIKKRHDAFKRELRGGGTVAWPCPGLAKHGPWPCRAMGLIDIVIVNCYLRKKLNWQAVKGAWMGVKR